MESNNSDSQTIGSALASAIERVKNAPVVDPADEAAREQREERDRRHAAAAKLQREAGGDRFEGHRFASWIPATDYQRSVKTALQEWAHTFPERRAGREGLVCFGPVGTGKDHLAFAAVRQAMIEHGATATWRNGRDLFGEVRDRIGEDRPERGIVTALETPDVLIISDPLPPIGDLSPHQADMLYRIVENRYAAGRITVVTLNVSDDDEADRRLGVATWDRLCHGAWKIAFKWASYRKPSRELKP